jgi:hypothetical protein
MKKDPEELNKLLKAISQTAVSAQFKKTDALKREKKFKTFEIADNFSVKLSGDLMKINYNILVIGKIFSQDKFKSDKDKVFDDIVKFLKKEVKEISGLTMSLEEVKEYETDCVQININKSIKNYTKIYRIKQLKKFALDEDDE